jgi:hypothetical protein
MLLSTYDYEICYKAGRLQKNVDPLSRREYEVPLTNTPDDEISEIICNLTDKEQILSTNSNNEQIT